MVLYLAVLSVAAILWRRAPRAAAPGRRFAILVPAHDEELLLPRLLQSLGALDYPRALYDVHVVADNCTDRTAAVAAAAGATVHVRTDDQRRGKGYALRWLLARLGRAGAAYDAYVILDADSVVSPNFLRVMSAHLARGDLAVQSYYGVLNRTESWPAALRYVALTLFNGLRPRGRDALGLSAGLRGNGMCFAAPLLERFGWDAFTLAEDAEFHLQLVAAGIRVTYAPQAAVLAEMPTALRQAHSQNVRWERGRLHLLRTYGPRLLAQGLGRRDAVLLDAVAEQLVPPLSILTAGTVLGVAGSAALQARGARRMGALVLLGQAGYVITGLRLASAEPRAYVALLWAPLYVLWKIWIYAISAAGIRRGRWVRTARSVGGRR
jgi:cellulose synthase/poly-beta-1,6-N-acetylglucosamine synthase-like glycosyltransferase